MVHGGGTSPVMVRRVFYSGADTLKEGYALCYNFNAADVTAENQTLSSPESVENSARRLMVEKPDIFNSLHFAGVVSNKSNGVIGPGWIEINCPGSICNIYCAAEADHETSDIPTNMNSGQMLTFDCDAYTFTYPGCPGSGSAMVLQDVDRSSTNGLVMAELMTGMPSGGIQTVSSLHFIATASAITVGGSVYVSPAGVTQITGDLDAALLVSNSGMGIDRRDVNDRVANVGSWVGQRKIFRTLTSFSISTPMTIVCISVARHIGTLSTDELSIVSGVLIMTSTISDYASFMWNGSRWELTSLQNSLCLFTT